MSLRSVARQALRSAGLEKIQHPSFVDLLLHEGIETIFDVGANEGQYGVELRERGFTGHIVSFEPIPEVYGLLADRASSDAKWEVHQVGVGDADGELSISVSHESVFSSFKQPSAYTSETFTGAREIWRRSVPVIRIDTFLSARPELAKNSFLKVDTQGFEKEVLSGAGESLSTFRGVQLELALQQLYSDQLTWLPMIEWLSRRGFSVAMAKENGFDWQRMRLVELDVLFWREAI